MSSGVSEDYYDVISVPISNLPERIYSMVPTLKTSIYEALMEYVK